MCIDVYLIALQFTLENISLFLGMLLLPKTIAILTRLSISPNTDNSDGDSDTVDSSAGFLPLVIVHSMETEGVYACI